MSRKKQLVVSFLSLLRLPLSFWGQAQKGKEETLGDAAEKANMDKRHPRHVSKIWQLRLLLFIQTAMRGLTLSLFLSFDSNLLWAIGGLRIPRLPPHSRNSLDSLYKLRVLTVCSLTSSLAEKKGEKAAGEKTMWLHQTSVKQQSLNSRLDPVKHPWVNTPRPGGRPWFCCFTPLKSCVRFYFWTCHIRPSLAGARRVGTWPKGKELAEASLS